MIMLPMQLSINLKFLGMLIKMDKFRRFNSESEAFMAKLLHPLPPSA